MPSLKSKMPREVESDGEGSSRSFFSRKSSRSRSRSDVTQSSSPLKEEPIGSPSSAKPSSTCPISKLLSKEARSRRNSSPSSSSGSSSFSTSSSTARTDTENLIKLDAILLDSTTRYELIDELLAQHASPEAIRKLRFVSAVIEMLRTEDVRERAKKSSVINRVFIRSESKFHVVGLPRFVELDMLLTRRVEAYSTAKHIIERDLAEEPAVSAYLRFTVMVAA